MNHDRRRFELPAGPTGAPVPPQKPKRLSRSFRRTQLTQPAAEVEPARSQQSDFKTPTRIQRSRAAAGFTGESLHNESDFQQDIIWDATSPSPNRLGKRRKKHRAGVVDISEIVSRIAPKHGRPKVAEPTLEQWIGDSAAIPCTPDVPVPKPKKKSLRLNGVDDLLKLAKQFDFNMFRQDEDKVEDLQPQSPELLSEDGDHDVLLPSLGNCLPAVAAACGNDHPDLQTDDDLDFLFDDSTQHISGDLSQLTSQAPAASCRETAGKPPLLPTTNTLCTLTNGEFEDDWENDDLLNDSLVFEMTQNPQNFSAPRHCSTQKPPSQLTNQRSPLHVPVSRGAGLGQSAAPKVEKDVRQRATFKLEPNPNFSLRNQTDSRTDAEVDYRSGPAEQQSRFSVKQGPQRTWHQNPEQLDPQEAQFHPRTSAANSKHVTTAQRLPPAVSELLDEDLSLFFLSDPVWDDSADDDLLCEMCEDLEKQIQDVENVPTKQTPPAGPVSDPRAALQPTNRNQPANQRAAPASDKPAGRSWAAGSVSSVPAAAQTNTVPDSFRFTQTKHASGRTNASSCVQACVQVSSAAPLGNSRKDQFTFKKPSNPVCMATSKVVGKCSAAEIELKKQQAMERRRQRLQAAQNL